MVLELSRLHNLIIGKGTGSPIQIGDLPLSVCRALKWRLPHVYLSRETCEHILAKHKDISLVDFLHLPFAITKGLIVEQSKRPNSIAACYTNAESGNQYLVAMKAAEKTCEIWVSTYHRLARRQAKSVLKTSKILKCHD